MRELNKENIREKLIEERENILVKLGNKDLSTDETEKPDPVDLAVRNYSKNVLLSVSENESKQLVQITEALERIENDEYGVCQNCENEINPKRLNAVPWARFCINCQELLEKGLIDEN